MSLTALALLTTYDLGRLALIAGGAAVGAAVARAAARRRYEAELAAEHRAHGARVRQLEASRLEVLAELGRAAAELAERALGEGRKADRRRAIAPERLESRPLAPWVPLPAIAPVAEVAPTQVVAAPGAAAVPLVLDLLEALPLRLEPTAPDPLPLDDRLPDVTLVPMPPPPRVRRRPESWSSPLVPLPRGDQGTVARP